MLNIDSLNLIKEMKDTEVFVQEQVIEKDDYLDLLSTFPLEQMAREDVHRKIALNKYNSTRGVDEGLTAQTKSVEIADLKAQVENTQTETIQGDQPYVANKNIASNRADK